MYTQRLAAPLSQILSDGTTTYLYGAERLRALNGPWHLSDALGSVRATLNDSGTALGAMRSDPWGQVQSGSVPTFGFTGELQREGLVQLRARWYNPAQGTLLGRDPFAGFPETPYSLHPYQYGYANPVSNTDPTGQVVYLFNGGWTDPNLVDKETITAISDYLSTAHPGLRKQYAADAISVGDVVYDIYQRFERGYSEEPIIVIGYSRGGASAQSVASIVSRADTTQEGRRGLIIDLVVAIAPVEATHNTYIWRHAKLSVVMRHVNIRSEQSWAAVLVEDPANAWPLPIPGYFAEREIAGADVQYVEPGTSHFTVAMNPMQRFKAVTVGKGGTIRVKDGPAVEPSPVYVKILQEVQAAIQSHQQRMAFSSGSGCGEWSVP